jgi:PII-like signaling protein
MKTAEVTMVRIYLTEEKAHLRNLLAQLHDWDKVCGVTVFRGISGFGKSGVMHSSTLLDMSLNLPVVVEFFDTPEKVEKILEHLNTFIEPGHIVSWPAYVNKQE